MKKKEIVKILRKKWDLISSNVCIFCWKCSKYSLMMSSQGRNK